MVVNASFGQIPKFFLENIPLLRGFVGICGFWCQKPKMQKKMFGTRQRSIYRAKEFCIKHVELIGFIDQFW